MAVKVTTSKTSKPTVPKVVKAGSTTPYDTPGAEYYAAQTIAANRIASYQAGNKPYVTSTTTEYAAAAKMAATAANDKLQASLSGPTASYTGGAYPGYTPPQVKIPTNPMDTGTGLPPMSYSQAPDPRNTSVLKPYDTPGQEYYDAKTIADNANAAGSGVGDDSGGGGGGGYAYAGGGGGSWVSRLINWRI